MKLGYISLAYLFSISSLLIVENEAYAAAPKAEETEVSLKPANPSEAKEAPKKNKAHFVGVRRPSEKSEEKKRPSSTIKNQWVKTKTHPKKEKKQPAKEQEKEEPPADVPYFNPSKALSSLAKHTSFATSSLLLQDEPLSDSSYEPEMLQQETLYPVLGTNAPYGHVFFTADWLLWRTRQGDMEFAVQGVSTSSLTPFMGSTTNKLNFDLKSGFRVGFGVHLPNDGWDIYLNYTDFRPNASKSVEGPLFPLLLYNPPFIATSAHAEWKIFFKTLDIEIGRAYYIGKSLSFRPFIGMTGAWIDQQAHVRYEAGSISFSEIDHIATHNDFKGAGPRLGMDSNWYFGEGLSLFANLATVITVGHFDLENNQTQGDLETIRLKSDLNLLSPVLQLIAGLAWDRNYHRDQWHVGFSAGFETQYWWRQNQMERFTDSIAPIFVRAESDLSFYGLTLRGRFDF